MPPPSGLGSFILQLGVNDGQFTASLNQAGKTAVLFQRTLTNTGFAVDNLNKEMNTSTAGVTNFTKAFDAADLSLAAFAATAGIIFRNALASFTDFESGVVRVSKVVDALSGDSLAKFSSDILTLSTRLPVTSNELIDIAQNLGQLGFFAKDTSDTINNSLVSSVDLVARVSTALGISAEQAAANFGILRSVFVESTASSDEATRKLSSMSDVVNELSNTTNATADNILDFTRRIGATGRAAGFTFEQLAALGATTRNLGISTEVSATALQGFFTKFTTRAEVFADAIGITVQEFQKLFRANPNQALVTFLESLAEKTNEQRTAVLEAVGDSARFTTVLNGLVNNVGAYRDSLVTATGAAQEGISVQKEYERAAATLANTLKLAGNNIQASVIQGFSVLAPVVQVIAESFNSLAASAPGLTAALSTLGVAGAAILGSLAAIALLTPKIAAGFKTVRGVIGDTTTALSNMALIGNNSLTRLSLGFARLKVRIYDVNGQLVKGNALLAGYGRGVAIIAGLAKAFTALLSTAVIGVGVAVVENLTSVRSELLKTRETLDKALASGDFGQVFDSATASAEKMKESMQGVVGILANVFSFGIANSKKNAAVQDLEAIAAAAKAAQESIDTTFKAISEPPPAANELSQRLLDARAEVAKAVEALTGSREDAIRAVTGQADDVLQRLLDAGKVGADTIKLVADAGARVTGRVKAEVEFVTKSVEEAARAAEQLARLSRVDSERASIAARVASLQKEASDEAAKFADNLADQAKGLDGLTARQRRLYEGYERQYRASLGVIEAQKTQLANDGAILRVREDGTFEIEKQGTISAETVKKNNENLEILNQAVIRVRALVDGQDAYTRMIENTITEEQKLSEKLAQQERERNIAAKERAILLEAESAKLKVLGNDARALANIEAAAVVKRIQVQKELAAAQEAVLRREQELNGLRARDAAVADRQILALRRRSAEEQLQILDDFLLQQQEAFVRDTQTLQQEFDRAQAAAADRKPFGASSNPAIQQIRELRNQAEDILKIRADTGVVDKRVNQLKSEALQVEINMQKELKRLEEERAKLASDRRLAEIDAATKLKLLEAEAQQAAQGDPSRAGRARLAAANAALEVEKQIVAAKEDGVLTEKEINDVAKARENEAIAQIQARQKAGEISVRQAQQEIKDAKQLIDIQRQGDIAKLGALDEEIKRNRDLLAVDPNDPEAQRRLNELEKQRAGLVQGRNDAADKLADAVIAENKAIEDIKIKQQDVKDVVDARKKSEQEINDLIKDRNERLKEELALQQQLQQQRNLVAGQAQELGANVPANPAPPAAATGPSAATAAGGAAGVNTSGISTAADRVTRSLGVVDTALQTVQSAMQAAATSIVSAADRVGDSAINFSNSLGGLADRLTGSLTTMSEKLDTAILTIDDVSVRLATIEGSMSSVSE